jgi:hypothetical protein
MNTSSTKFVVAEEMAKRVAVRKGVSVSECRKEIYINHIRISLAGGCMSVSEANAALSQFGITLRFSN